MQRVLNLCGHRRESPPTCKFHREVDHEAAFGAIPIAVRAPSD